MGPMGFLLVMIKGDMHRQKNMLSQQQFQQS